ncbi:MAG: hypothetical protein EOO77_20270 [Oxalobacteraceae bacterium]|nr:MAG: hypothetical protein EOO77_20270 [Oxalobacteraceae bacterium]
MAQMTIRATNSTFESVSTGEYEHVDYAYRAGLKAALEIARSEIEGGANSVIIEVAVDLEDRRYAARGALAISTAPMFAPVEPSATASA